jgi:hypothetical protein
MITPQDKALRSRVATPFTRRFELCECSESAAAARQRVMKFRGLFRFGGNKIAQSGAMGRPATGSCVFPRPINSTSTGDKEMWGATIRLGE